MEARRRAAHVGVGGGEGLVGCGVNAFFGTERDGED